MAAAVNCLATEPEMNGVFGVMGTPYSMFAEPVALRVDDRAILKDADGAPGRVGAIVAGEYGVIADHDLAERVRPQWLLGGHRVPQRAPR